MSQHLSCPHIFDSVGRAIPISHIDVDISITMTVATVLIRTTFINNTGSALSGIFKCPTNFGRAHISSCDVLFSGKLFVTSVIDPDIVRNTHRSTDPAASMFDPLAFSMSVADTSSPCPPNCEIIVSVNYIQYLECNRMGVYELLVPTCVPPHLVLPNNNRQKELCSVRCALDVGTQNCQWYSNTHQMVTSFSAGPCLTLQSQPSQLGHNSDFHIQYSAYSPTITATCLMQYSPQQQGNFVAFISPPSNIGPDSFVGRDIVFLLDRSGSMGGSPMDQAKSAIITALSTLSYLDRFAICAFDDVAEWCSPNLESASAPQLLQAAHQNIQFARQWLHNIQARGLTDIFTPYQAATNMLLREESVSTGRTKASSIVPSAVTTNIPIIFLVTDGAVKNEEAICTFAQQHSEEHHNSKSTSKSIRTFTCGIGPYANQYFLKALAAKGRGYSHICMYQELIETSIVDLMNRSESPLLMNVVLDFPKSVRLVNTSPSICPDLYHGCPVVLCGKFMDDSFPAQINVCGVNSYGELVQITMSVRSPYTTGNVNLGIAYAVSFMDSQIADYWLYSQLGDTNAAKKCKQKAVSTSLDSSIPCVFTQAVAYETDSQSHGGHAAQHNPSGKKNTGMSNGALVAGGLVLLAVTASSVVMFGNISATSNNLPVTQVFQALSSINIDASFLHAVVDNLSAAGQGLGGVARNLGNALAPTGHVIGQSLNTAGRGVVQVGGHVGQTLAPAGHVIGNGLITTGRGVVHVGGQVGQTFAPAVQTMGDGFGYVGHGIAQTGGNLVQAGANEASNICGCCSNICDCCAGGNLCEFCLKGEICGALSSIRLGDVQNFVCCILQFLR